MWWDEVLVFERQPLSCVTKFTKWTRNVGQFLRGSDRNHCDLCLLGWEMYARTATGTGQIYRVKELKQRSFNISVGSDGWNTEPLLFDTLQLNPWKEEKKNTKHLHKYISIWLLVPPGRPMFQISNIRQLSKGCQNKSTEWANRIHLSNLALMRRYSFCRAPLRHIYISNRYTMCRINRI